MKKVSIAFVCTLAVAACGGEQKPAQSPAMTTSTTTSEMMTTTPQPPPAPAPVTPPPLPETDMSAPRSYSMPDNSAIPGTTDSPGGAGTTDATGLPAPPTPSTEPSTGTTSSDADKMKETTKTTEQGGAASDKTINTAVRSALAADTTLAAASKNVKITTASGKVTLRGTVKSDDDKSAVEAKARATPGVTDVDNQIQVKK